MTMSVDKVLGQLPAPFQEQCRTHVDSADTKRAVTVWTKEEVEKGVYEIERCNQRMESHASWTNTLWKVATVISLALLAVTLALGCGLGVPMGPLFLIFALVPAATSAMSLWQWVANQAGDLQGKELAQKVAEQLLVADEAQLGVWDKALIRP